VTLLTEDVDRPLSHSRRARVPSTQSPREAGHADDRRSFRDRASRGARARRRPVQTGPYRRNSTSTRSVLDVCGASSAYGHSHRRRDSLVRRSALSREASLEGPHDSGRTPRPPTRGTGGSSREGPPSRNVRPTGSVPAPERFAASTDVPARSRRDGLRGGRRLCGGGSVAPSTDAGKGRARMRLRHAGDLSRRARIRDAAMRRRRRTEPCVPSTTAMTMRMIMGGGRARCTRPRREDGNRHRHRVRGDAASVLTSASPPCSDALGEVEVCVGERSLRIRLFVYCWVSRNAAAVRHGGAGCGGCRVDGVSDSRRIARRMWGVVVFRRVRLLLWVFVAVFGAVG
jgi:hypothetical protein